MRLSTLFRTLPLLVGLHFAPIARAQVEVTWSASVDPQATFGGLFVDAAGTSYVGGDKASLFNSGLYVAKYAQDGTLTGAAQTGNPAGADLLQFRALSVDTDGSVYLVGRGQMPASVPDRWAVFKITSSGLSDWAFTSLNGSAAAIALDHNGGVYVAGFTDGARIVKFTTGGQQQWITPQLANANNVVLSMPRSDLLLLGATAQLPSGDVMRFCRIDPATGAVIWSRDIGGGPNPSAHMGDLAADATGHVVVGGTHFTASGISGMTVALYDEHGTPSWVREYDASLPLNDSFGRIAIDPAGRVVATGERGQGQDRDIFTLAHDFSGTLLWMRLYDSGHNDRVGSLSIGQQGEIVCSGASGNDILESVYGQAIAYDSAGNLRWTFEYPTPPLMGGGELSISSAGPNRSFLLGGGFSDANGNVPVLLRLDPNIDSYCLGDGSAAACPCANSSAPNEHAGCASSLGVGAKLDYFGSASLLHDSLTLIGTNLPDSNVLYVQGALKASGGAGSAFGDGLRCVGGTLTRLGIRTSSGGASEYPGPGAAPVSAIGSVAGPGTRTYQVIYRDAAAFCTSATFNLTNGLLVTWTP